MRMTALEKSLGALAAKTKLLWLFLLIFGPARTTSEQSDPTVVDLGYAQYQGTFNASINTTTFYGIRYAAPPIGEQAVVTSSISSDQTDCSNREPAFSDPVAAR